jgi:uncharacterized phiE125 gp8 family phage protein
MNLITTVQPASLPITAGEAKRHARVTGTADDGEIDLLIRAATSYAETFMRRVLITRTNVLRLDRFPSGPIYLPEPPLRSVSSIAYIDESGDSQTWASSKYDVDVYSEPGRIEPSYGEIYPATRADMNAVTVTYVCGHSTLMGSVSTGTEVITATGHPYTAGNLVDGLYLSGAEADALPAGMSQDLAYYAIETIVAATSLQLSTTSGGSTINITDTGTGGGYYIGLIDRAIRNALTVLVADMFDNRENDPRPEAPATRAAERLMATHRVMLL